MVEQRVTAWAGQSSLRHFSVFLHTFRAIFAAGLNIQKISMGTISPIPELLYAEGSNVSAKDDIGNPFAMEPFPSDICDVFAGFQDPDPSYTRDSFNTQPDKSFPPSQNGYLHFFHGAWETLHSLTISFNYSPCIADIGLYEPTSAISNVYVPHLHTLRLVEYSLPLSVFERFMLKHAETLSALYIGRRVHFAPVHPQGDDPQFMAKYMSWTAEGPVREKSELLKVFEKVGKETWVTEVTVEGDDTERAAKLEALLKGD